MAPLKPLRGLLLGAPGAGKGTQASRILRDFAAIKAISSGDLLRANIAQQTPLGKQAESVIKTGALLPDDTMVELISSELTSRSWLGGSSSWMLDGFPRTVAQAQLLDEFLEPANSPLNAIIELRVPESVILDRIENRYVHVPSGRVYNLTFNPPKEAGKDDVTGEPLTKRPDDTREVFQKRLDSYRELTLPLLDYYGSKGIVHSFAGETSDIIYPQIKEFLERW